MQLLKLLALDEQDLEILSAHCQDAVLKPTEIVFLPREKRLLLTMNRFAWEKRSGFFSRRHERRRSVVHFEGVTAVRSSGIDRRSGEDVLSLLSVSFAPGELPAGELQFSFSGGATIAADVEFIEARLADLGPAWATRVRPRHGV